MTSIPRVHGNGFIQLEVTPTTRLHVWPGPGGPKVRQQTVNTGIHTHRFSYRSTVLTGTLYQRRYRFVVGPVPGEYELYVPTTDEKLAPTGVRGWLEQIDIRTLAPGDIYTLSAGEFHEIIPVTALSATLMVKVATYPQMPVYIACNKVPDNEFDRDTMNDPDELMKIIGRALGA